MRDLRESAAAAVAVSMLIFVVAHQVIQGRANAGLPQGEAGAVDIDDLRSKWMESVSGILAAYDEEPDAQKARDALLALRVPADAQHVHLGLVLAFQAEADKSANSRATMEEVRAAFTEYASQHP